MSTVRDGTIQIYATEKATPEVVAIKGGFAEVNARGLTILAEQVA